MRQHGFTFVELIMVVVIIGVLAVFAAPRMFNTGEFREQGFTAELRAALRYAQKSAVAANCPVNFTTTAAGYSAAFTCAAANVPSPKGDAGGLAGAVPAGSGITLTATTITFSGAGLRTSASDAGVNTQTITITGTEGRSYTATVYATGYVQ